MKLILLGSGPSLRQFDLGHIGLTRRDQYTVGINSAGLKSLANITFSADRLWIEKNIYWCGYGARKAVFAWNGELPPLCRGNTLISLNPCAECGGIRILKKRPDWQDHRNIHWIARRRCNGFAADGVNGSTSGFGALNWAVRCGAKRILLLGYDYRSDGPHRHWYDEEETTEPGRAVDLWSQWVTPFDEALPELRQLDVQVMNGSPESAIRAFPKCTPEEGLRWFDAQ